MPCRLTSTQIGLYGWLHAGWLYPVRAVLCSSTCHVLHNCACLILPRSHWWNCILMLWRYIYAMSHISHGRQSPVSGEILLNVEPVAKTTVARTVHICMKGRKSGYIMGQQSVFIVHKKKSRQCFLLDHHGYLCQQREALLRNLKLNPDEKQAEDSCDPVEQFTSCRQLSRTGLHGAHWSVLLSSQTDG